MGDYGERRLMVLHTVGHAWTDPDIDQLELDSEWVHLAPLLRSDFSTAAVARPAVRGHGIAYDGQEVVRVPRIGELTLGARYDPEWLRHLTVLKLSKDETAVLAEKRARERAIESLWAISELLLTLGFRGAEIRVGGTVTHVAPDRGCRGRADDRRRRRVQ